MQPRKIHFFVLFSLVTECGLLLSGCRSNQNQSASGLTPVTLQLDWYPQPEHGGFFAAQLLGYYKAEGLDVTLSPLPRLAPLSASPPK